MDTHAVILFDGDCIFCKKSVRFIMKRDKHAYFMFAALNGEAGTELKRKYNVPDSFDSIVLLENGQYYTASTAVLRICKALHGIYPFLYMFIIIPKPLRDIVYQQIARKRHKLSKNNACELPGPEEKKRLLD